MRDLQPGFNGKPSSFLAPSLQELDFFFPFMCLLIHNTVVSVLSLYLTKIRLISDRF